MTTGGVLLFEELIVPKPEYAIMSKMTKPPRIQ